MSKLKLALTESTLRKATAVLIFHIQLALAESKLRNVVTDRVPSLQATIEPATNGASRLFDGIEETFGSAADRSAVLGVLGSYSPSGWLFPLIIIAVALRLYLFPAHAETSAELMRAYVLVAENGSIPGFNTSLTRLSVIWLRAPPIYVLNYYFVQILGLDGEIALRIVRILLGVSATVLVYGISRQLGMSDRSAFAAGLLFTTSVHELLGVEVHFKNMLGVTATMTFVYLLASILSDGRNTYRWENTYNKPLLGALLLVLGLLVTAHRMYFPIVLVIIGFFIITWIFRRWGFGTFLSLSLAGIVLVLGMRVFASLFRELLIAIPQVYSRFRFDFLSDPFLAQVVSPGIVSLNLQILLALLGALLWLRDPSASRGVTLLSGVFITFLVLSKDYLLGFPFAPTRFRLLLPPFLAIFMAYALGRIWTTKLRPALARGLYIAGIIMIVSLNMALIHAGTAVRSQYLWTALRRLLESPYEYLFWTKYPVDGGAIALVLLLFGFACIPLLKPLLGEIIERTRDFTPPQRDGYMILFVFAVAIFLAPLVAFERWRVLPPVQLVGVLSATVIPGYTLFYVHPELGRLAPNPLVRGALAGVVGVSVTLLVWMVSLFCFWVGLFSFDGAVLVAFAVQLAAPLVYVVGVSLYRRTDEEAGAKRNAEFY